MTSLGFIVALCQALAWPVTAAVIFLFLRKPIVALLPTVRELKYKNVQITFGEKVRELASEAVETLPSAAKNALPVGERSRLDRLADLSPRSAILEAWIPVEQTAFNLALARGITSQKAQLRSPRDLVDALHRAGVVSAGEASVFNALRSLRNDAAHAIDFAAPHDAVAEFIELAERLAGTLRSRQAGLAPV